MTSLNTIEKAGATEFTTPSDRELVATRIVNAPRDLVWAAWINPHHLPHWMLGPEGWTMPICEVDLRPGGAWRFGWRGPGPAMEMHGAYREVIPPERLVSTENWGGEWPETLNTLVLTEKDGRTTMTCTVRYPSNEAREAALATGMKQGWSASYDRLDRYLPTMSRPAGAPQVQQSSQDLKAAPASRKIFVNLPVKDLKRSMDFFRALGFTFNPQFTDDTAACMVISEDIYAMLLTIEKFRIFTPNEVCNANKSTEVLLALTCESREAVGQMMRNAIAEGGRRYSEPKGHGFMLQDGFQDLDGHIWELIYMEPGALQQD